jgi:hypothetical protein
MNSFWLPLDHLIRPLLPPEMARRAEETGVDKVPMDALGTLALAVLAGGLIPS